MKALFFSLTFIQSNLFFINIISLYSLTSFINFTSLIEVYMPKAIAKKYLHLRYSKTKTLCEETGRAKVIGVPISVNSIGFFSRVILDKSDDYLLRFKDKVTCPECRKELALMRLRSS